MTLPIRDPQECVGKVKVVSKLSLNFVNYFSYACTYQLNEYINVYTRSAYRVDFMLTGYAQTSVLDFTDFLCNFYEKVLKYTTSHTLSLFSWNQSSLFEGYQCPRISFGAFRHEFTSTKIC